MLARLWAADWRRWERPLRFLLIAVALLGFASFAVRLSEAIVADGGRAYDAFSYWLAGVRVREGVALYEEVGIGDPGAYRYTPTFAIFMAPISLLPELAFAWLYRIA